MPDETTPLLWEASALDNPHKQFCALAGVPPSNSKDKHPEIGPKTLYGRATKRYAKARRGHNCMSALNNILLLSQVVLGATLTALGASESSHILITIFGVMNTIIAGLVAYLKSRGQPARTRLFRDDLERVVDEIENSEIMWLGISQNIHGYDEIDIDDKVTVRSEVARLMRLYEKATRSFMMSNPDNYLMGQSDSNGQALRSRAGIGGGFPPAPVTTLPAVPAAMPAATPGPSAPAEPAAPAPPAKDDDPDQAPASAPSEAVKPSSDDGKGKEKEPGADAKDDAPASGGESSKDAASKPSSDDSKDKPPSYKDKDTPPEAKDKDTLPDAKDKDKPKPDQPPAEPEQQPQQQPPPDAPAQAPLASDPDESPAMAASGFERTDDEDDETSKKSKGSKH